MANNIFSVVTLKFKTPEAGEAFADKFGNCDMLDMELYKYLGFDDYPSRSEAIDHGGAKWFWLHDNPQPGYGEDETEVHMCIESAWYIPNNLFETIAKQEDCSITGYAEDEYRNAWTLFEFNQDFDDYEVYDSFLRDDTISQFKEWCIDQKVDLNLLYEAADDPGTFEDEIKGGELIREFLIDALNWSNVFFHDMPPEFTYTYNDLTLIREELATI